MAPSFSRRKTIPLLLAAAVCVLAVSLLGSSHQVSAQSAVGSGGDLGPGDSDGGGGGGTNTNNGHGWFRFSSSGAGPRDFKDDSSWSSVSRTCRNLNTEYVIVYIIARSDGNPYNAMGFNYKNEYASYSGYRSGGNWLSPTNARAAFNTISAPPGYTFGSNVSWFCYTEGGYEFRAGTYIVTNPADLDTGRRGAAGRTITARPGQTVYWRSNVDNTGNRAGSFRASIGTRYNDAAYFYRPFSDRHSLAAGATFLSEVRSYRIPSNAPHGALYCQNYRLDTTSQSNGNDLYTAGACARVEAQWSITGTSTADRATAAPGQTITWRHIVRNVGPSNTTLPITSWLNRAGFSSGNGTGNTANTPAGRPVGEFRNSTATYIVRASDAGRTLCQSIAWRPTANSNSAERSSAASCVNIPFSYSLVPRVAPLNDVAEPGSELTVRSYVRNNGPTQSQPVQWQLTRVDLSPGQSIPGGGNSGSNPCAFFGGNCQRVEGGDNHTFQLNETALPPAGYNLTVGDIPVGSKICFAMSVQPRAHNSGEWRHSNLECTVVGKKPKVHVFGGDVASRGRVLTSTTVKGGTTYGSWVEYGALVRETLSGFSSGAGLAVPDTPASDLNLLTFTNNNASLGNFTSSTYWARPLALTSDRFRLSSGGSGSLPGGDMGGWSSGTYQAGNVTLPGGTIPAGRSIVIVSTGTVTINSNITYNSGAINRINDIPQVVIVANNINIAGGVEQVDAWLLAPTGNINTCSDVAPTAALTSNICNRKLTINGPVVADKLHLRRTAGSGTGDQSADPAEVINLRADAYIWAYLRAGGPGKAQTVLTTEKAPRY